MRVCARALWGSKGDEYPLQDAGIVGILPPSADSLQLWATALRSKGRGRSTGVKEGLA